MSGPRKVQDVLAELFARRGYARVQSQNRHLTVWREAAGGTMADQTRVGQVRRGVLEVMVANSTLLQELTFQKRAILTRWNELLPEQRLTDLRCRVGPVQ